MSALTDLDTSYLKSINALHSKDHLHSSKPALQTFLEEAIKSKTGKDMNLTAMVQTLMKQSGVETLKSSIEETKVIISTSDNELELDLLLNGDLACVICQGMDVGARNRLLECSDCHALYHQECHQPPVTQQEADIAWVCANCKEVKKVKKSPTHSSSSSSSHVSSKLKSSSNSPRHSIEKSERSERSDRGDRGDRSDRSDRSERSSNSSGYKSSSSTSKSTSKSSSSGGGSGSKSSSSSSSSKSSSSKHTPVTTSIVSADKRLQNMKKKAAKLHEKKKLPR